jgi:hypothetical protein
MSTIDPLAEFGPTPVRIEQHIRVGSNGPDGQRYLWAEVTKLTAGSVGWRVETRWSNRAAMDKAKQEPITTERLRAFCDEVDVAFAKHKD